MGFLDRLVGRSMGRIPTLRPRVDAIHIHATTGPTSPATAARRSPPTASPEPTDPGPGGDPRPPLQPAPVDQQRESRRSVQSASRLANLDGDTRNEPVRDVTPGRTRRLPERPIVTDSPVSQASENHPTNQIHGWSNISSPDPDPADDIVPQDWAVPTPTWMSRLPTLLPEPGPDTDAEEIALPPMEARAPRSTPSTSSPPSGLPDVQVTIGRVEVVTSGQDRRPQATSGPVMSLGQYLEKREKS